ncbi:glycosyltransferase family 4 protein [Akkermansiaceae bacterium]|nr:glycosyltransferase family 4 protein [Akkermansiaceae bacterium]
MKDSQSHFVFINQYYPPDLAPTGVMLRDVAEEMVARGIHVTILCSKGGYSGKRAGGQDIGSSGKVEVVRVPTFRFGRQTLIGKVCDYASFYLFALLYALAVKGKPTCYVALTTPPYLGLLARLVSKFRGARHAHWVMDLYPDMMVADGILREGNLLCRCFRWVTTQGFGGNRCAGVLTLGPDMIDLTARYLKDNVKREWIPLWSGAESQDSDSEDQNAIDEWRAGLGWQKDELIYMYSGNMGRGHRFSEFLNAIKSFCGSEKKVRFVFCGGGAKRVEIESFISEYESLAVEMMEYVTAENLPLHLASADVHLASMEPHWRGTMVPSKIQGILSSGRPLVYVGALNSTIGRWVVEANSGWVVEPDDHTAMGKALAESMDYNLRRKKGGFGYQFYKRNFQRDLNSKRVADFFLVDTTKKN